MKMYFQRRYDAIFSKLTINSNYLYNLHEEISIFTFLRKVGKNFSRNQPRMYYHQLVAVIFYKNDKNC